MHAYEFECVLIYRICRLVLFQEDPMLHPEGDIYTDYSRAKSHIATTCPLRAIYESKKLFHLPSSSRRHDRKV